MINTIDHIRAAIAAIKAGVLDDEVNRRCAIAFGWKEETYFTPISGTGSGYEWKGLSKNGKWEIPKFTASFDAIMAEKPEGWCYVIDSLNNQASIGVDTDWPGWIEAEASTANRALLLALLLAMEAQTK